MREAYLEIIEKSITDEERQKVLAFLKKKDPKKEEITIADIPDCFGFYSSSDKECAICMLRRVCEIAVQRVTLPYVIDFLASQSKEERIEFLRKACASWGIGVGELGLGDVSADEKSGKHSVKKVRRVKAEGKEILPPSTVKEVEYDEFGFRKDSKVSRGAEILKKYKRLDDAAREYADVLGIDVKKARRLLTQIPYYLKKKGFKVCFRNGEIVWEKG
jgi:hypothetical protein